MMKKQITLAIILSIVLIGCQNEDAPQPNENYFIGTDSYYDNEEPYLTVSSGDTTISYYRSDELELITEDLDSIIRYISVSGWGDTVRIVDYFKNNIP